MRIWQRASFLLAKKRKKKKGKKKKREKDSRMRSCSGLLRVELNKSLIDTSSEGTFSNRVSPLVPGRTLRSRPRECNSLWNNEKHSDRNFAFFATDVFSRFSVDLRFYYLFVQGETNDLARNSLKAKIKLL